MDAAADHDEAYPQGESAVKLEAYMIRTSYLQQRLLSTLDAMDALQSLHAHELAERAREKALLLRRLEECQSHLMAVEAEKETLRCAMTGWIEKGESLSGYNQCAPSSMRLSTPVAPIDVLYPSSSTSSYQELVPQISSILSALKTEMTHERARYRNSIAEAVRRITDLEARLALREAELEACVLHINHHSLLLPARATSAPTSSPLRKSGCSPLSDDLDHDRALRAVELNASRHRTLECELRILLEKLQVDESTYNVPSSRLPSHPSSTFRPVPGIQTTASHLSHWATDLQCTPGTRIASPPTVGPVEALGRQVQTLATAVDKLASQRRLLAGTLKGSASTSTTRGDASASNAPNARITTLQSAEQRTSAPDDANGEPGPAVSNGPILDAESDLDAVSDRQECGISGMVERAVKDAHAELPMELETPLLGTITLASPIERINALQW